MTEIHIGSKNPTKVQAAKNILEKSSSKFHAELFVILKYMKTKKNNRTDLTTIGFALLLPGLFLSTILDTSRIIQIIGVILVLASTAVFGVVISARKTSKK